MLVDNWLRWPGLMFEADGGGSGGGAGSDGDDGADDSAGGDDGGGTPTVESLAAELAQTRAALKKANKEAAERRVKLQEIEAAENKRKESELSEVEKAQKRAEMAEAQIKELQKTMKTQTIRHAVMVEASVLKFHKPEEAFRLADLSAVTVDDGQVSGVRAALEALAKASPHLVQKANAGDLNSGSGGRQRAPSLAEVEQAKRQSGAYVRF